jgi:hypothetical protein
MSAAAVPNYVIAAAGEELRTAFGLTDARTKLTPGKHYAIFRKLKNGTTKREPVGEFKRVYIMGSGNGQTVHYEFFSKDGKIHTIVDDYYNPTNISAFQENIVGGKRRRRSTRRRSTRRRHSRRRA